MEHDPHDPVAPGSAADVRGPGPAGSGAAAERPVVPDHRRLGRELGLFASEESVGAGFPLWLPDGEVVVAELQRYITGLERRAGYRHVRTPPVGKRELYERSGHWEHFSADMFPPMPLGGGAGEDLVLRPVLCPHHALVYRSRQRSHRDLPLRLAEFGQMFRNERSGVVGGLSRVRAITLNDAHVYCAPDQVVAEVVRVLRMVDEAYPALGITPAYAMVAVRGPGRSYAGSEESWERAEAVLWEALRRHGLRARRVAGEAAFYGPKIDLQVYDARGAEVTLSTVQVDHVQPERFDLAYVAPDGSRQRPVVVHRSVLSAMERMVAHLLEAHAGALPPWLSPVQLVLVPVSPAEREPAAAAADRARSAGLRAEVDDRAESVAARVRLAATHKVPYIGVVGPREAADGSLTVRLRDGSQVGPHPLERALELIGSVVRRRAPRDRL